jgi:aminoglycoside 6'-N-acetyltransferase I
MTLAMHVRLIRQDDLETWCAMRAALWPDEDMAALRAEAEAFFSDDTSPNRLHAVFLCEDRNARPLGMLELSLRSYAEGCSSSPVPYVEGWFVVPDAQRRGVGRALIDAAEKWAAERGFTEIASDALLGNTVSERAHLAIGFQEVERSIHFRKEIGPRSRLTSGAQP